MCDQTQVSYLPGDVVWVKLSPLWWPGQIVAKNEIDESIIKNLKSLVAVVKFFEEDTYEFVKNLSNIYHYNCLRKVEFIKKGLNALRSGIKGSSSNVKRFPEDVIAAEVLTGGNPNILNDDIFQPEEKVDYKDLFPSASSKKTPKRPRLSETAIKQKESPYSTLSPAVRTITHPRFIKSNLGLESNHDVKILIQKTSVPNDSPAVESSPTIYKCHACNFTTVRINVLILHNRSHWQNCDGSKNGKKKEGRSGLGNKSKSKIFSFVNQTPAGTKRKSETTSSLKKKTSNSTDKTNRNSQSATADQTLSDTSDHKAPDSDDNLHDSLLEDWMEYENLVEADTKVDCVQIDDQSEKIANDDVKLKNKMSCFDFDETEDDSTTVQSDNLYKRKIPRQIRERKLYSDAAECVPAVAATATAAATTDTGVDDCRARNNINRNKRIYEDGGKELENVSVDEKIINDLKRLSDEINVERINKFIDEVGNATLKPINKSENSDEPLIITSNQDDCRDDSDSIEDSINHRADNNHADAEDEISYLNTENDKYSPLNNTVRTVEIVSGNPEEHIDTSNRITNTDIVRKDVDDESDILQNGFVNSKNVNYLTSNMVERTVEFISENLVTVSNIDSNLKGNAENEFATDCANENISRRDLINTENGECLSINYSTNGIVLEQDSTAENANSITVVQYAKDGIIIADNRLNEKVNVSRHDLINIEKTPNGVEQLAKDVLDNTAERDSTVTDVNSNLHAVADNGFVKSTKFSSLGTNGSSDESNLSSVHEQIVSFNGNRVREISGEDKEESNENYFKGEEFSATTANNKINNNPKTAIGVVAEESNDNVTIMDGSNDITQVRNLDHNIIISNIAEVELRTSSDECVKIDSERDHDEETIIINSSSNDVDTRKNDNEIFYEFKNDERIKNHRDIKTSPTSCGIVIQSIRQLTVDNVGKNKLDERKVDGLLPKERELTPCTNNTVNSGSTIRTNEIITRSAELFGNEEKVMITNTLCNARVQLEAGINDFDDDDEDTQEDTNLLREEIDQLISQPEEEEGTLQDVDLHDDGAADGDEMQFEDFLKFNKIARHNRDENKTEYKDFVESEKIVPSHIAYSNSADNYSGITEEIVGPNRNVILETAKLVGESATDVKMIALHGADNSSDVSSVGYDIYTFVDRKTGQQNQYILNEQQKIALLRGQLTSVNKLKVVASNIVDEHTSSPPIERIVSGNNSLYNLDVTHQHMKQTLINDSANSRQLYVASYEHVENPSGAHRTMSAENAAAHVISGNPIIVRYKSNHGDDVNDRSAQNTSFAIISASPTVCRSSYDGLLDGNNVTNDTSVVDNELQDRQLQNVLPPSYQLISAKLNKDVQTTGAANNNTAVINATTKQDILAKALECTDVLHTSHQIYNDLNYDGRTKSTNLTLKQTPIVTPMEKSSSTSCTFSSIEEFTWATQH